MPSLLRVGCTIAFKLALREFVVVHPVKNHVTMHTLIAANHILHAMPPTKDSRENNTKCHRRLLKILTPSALSGVWPNEALLSV
jgi:hypothetical protein